MPNVNVFLSYKHEWLSKTSFAAWNATWNSQAYRLYVSPTPFLSPSLLYILSSLPVLIMVVWPRSDWLVAPASWWRSPWSCSVWYVLVFAHFYSLLCPLTPASCGWRQMSAHTEPGSAVVFFHLGGLFPLHCRLLFGDYWVFMHWFYAERLLSSEFRASKCAKVPSKGICVYSWLLV